MKSDRLRASWGVLLPQLAIALAAFAGGWCSHALTKTTGDLPSGKSTASQSAAQKNIVPSAAGRLAQAKARMAQILKIADENKRGYAMYDFVGTLDAETVKALLGDLAAKPFDAQHGSLEFLSLMERWGGLDPRSALTWAQTLHDPRMKTFGLEQVFGGWANQNPADAFVALTQLKGAAGIGNRSLSAIVIQDYARQNPQAALDALRSLPAGQLSDLYPAVFRVWAEENPSAAAAGVSSLPPSYNLSRAQFAIAGAWAAQDPDAALAWVKTLPAGPTQNNAMKSVLQTMSAVDPASAASYAINLPADSSRDNLLSNIAYSWAQQDPAGLLTWADDNLTGTAFDTAAITALQQMSNTNPEAAATTLAQLSDPNVVNKAIPALATNWAKQDPQAAMAWAQSLSPDFGSLRNSAIANAFNAWATADPAASGSYIQQNLAGDPAFGKLAAQVVDSWGNTDPQAALRWAQQLPAGTAQGNAINEAITQLAKVDPQTAWQDASQLSGSGAVSAQVNVLSAWAAQQPAQAAAALQGLPPGGTANTATANVAKSWLAQDPQAASQWIDTLPSGPARDSAVTQIISTVGSNDPAAAFNWAVTIGDATVRNAQIAKLAAQWSNGNATAAAAAAQKALDSLTGLTPDQQAALQKVVDNATAQ
jgi:hypothetical protein